MFTIKRLSLLFALTIFVASFSVTSNTFAETYTGDVNVNSTGGGDCILVGFWDDETKTCTLIKDISGPLNIGSAGITLDGAGHTISRNTQAPSFQRNGILISGSNVIFKNINVGDFTNCITFSGGTINNRVENSNISNCGSYGIYLPISSGGHIFLNNNFSQNYIGIFVSSSNNLIEGNTFSYHSHSGIRTYFSSNHTIKNNIFDNNRIGLYMEYSIGSKVTNNTIQNSLSHGLYTTNSGIKENYIVNNNFINNGNGQVSVFDKNQMSDALPIGGNYWSDYDSPSEGCNDQNVDSVCDQPKYLNTYNLSYGDFFPWVRKDGWKSAPPTCSDGIQNQDETGIDIGGVCQILSSEKSITSFSFKSLTPNVEGIIDEVNHTITLNVLFGTNVTTLVPTIVVSTGASSNPNNSVAQDFTNPAIYIITAEDGSTQTYTVTVTPSCTVNCFSNVLFLPGIEASRLYTPRANGSEDQLWEPNNNLDVEDLYLYPDGTSKNSNVYTRDIVEESNTPIPIGPAGINIYKSFAEMMDELVSDDKITEWKPYAYDWRQDVQDIVNSGTRYESGGVSLIDTLQNLADSSKNGKVTIIAHSNGGLLAKTLLKKLEDDKIAGENNLIDSVDALILVAVPEIGTAKAVPAILHGYDQSILGGFLIDETRARELGRNMIGAFGLLPSEEYINRVSASPATFVDNIIPSQTSTKLVQTFGSAIDSYSEYKDFLFGGEGRTAPLPIETNLPISLSQDLFAKAENLHESIDSWAPPSSLRVIEVAGWGIDTLASFEYYPRACTATLGCGFILDERPRFTADGDGTVVVPSAQYMSTADNAEKYWVNLFQINNDKFPLDKNIKHHNFLETLPALNLVSNIIQEINSPTSQYISLTSPVDTKNRLRISIHSPVTLDAYDAEGNHTGKICPLNSDFCYAEENIPNSSYLEFGEGKYINLPEDQLLKIKLQGTDVGTFTYDSEKVLPDGTSTTSSFVDIPVTTQTQAEVTLNPSGTPQMALDVTGDGITDFTLAPSSTFDPIIYLQIMKATIDSLDLPQSKIKAFDKRVDSIIKLIQEGKIDKAKLKADKFKNALEKKLAKLDPKHPKPKKLSRTDAELLLDMLNKLLDNLS